MTKIYFIDKLSSTIPWLYLRGMCKVSSPASTSNRHETCRTTLQDIFPLHTAILLILRCSFQLFLNILLVFSVSKFSLSWKLSTVVLHMIKNFIFLFVLG